jgi:hypothetical protein
VMALHAFIAFTGSYKPSIWVSFVHGELNGVIADLRDYLLTIDIVIFRLQGQVILADQTARE